MNDILLRIMEKKREEVAALKKELSREEALERAARLPPARDFTGALKGARPRGTGRRGAERQGGAGVNIIAEIKKRSPSKGAFDWHGDTPRQARAYAGGGAAAISVVTDGPFFGGDTGMLGLVREAVDIPVLQKDFLLEPWQVAFARSLGADACLLIAACLPGDLLAEMLEETRRVGIHALVEVIDEEELARAGKSGAIVIGVNNRDLKTFTIDPARTERLLPLYSDEQVAIAESGIHTPADVDRLLAAGVDGFLIGEALMKAADPAAHLALLRGA
ncbi:MAG: indole-3-glycerol phosphate synthase TrpC [Deltaproteobacteria bacterium]|nr:indole-3-glycerol phosphate synthase TrpC [Deltaproteobacteria bacterium]